MSVLHTNAAAPEVDRETPSVVDRSAPADRAHEVPEERWFAPVIARQTLKELMKRSDALGWRNFGWWLCLLLISGAGAAAAWGTWWAVPAFFVYGTLYCSSDARWHELAHGTPFKSPRLNQVFYQFCSFLTIREATVWKWSHARHHTHTIIIGRDPEIQVERPPKLIPLLLDFFYLVSGTKEIIKIAQHACGHVSREVRDFVPAPELRKMVWISRAYMAIAAAVVACAIATHSWLPLFFIWTPRFYCGWFHQLLGLTQHAGLAMDVTDHRLNSRTVYINPVFRFLYMNMNYHMEHHLLPMVPFHALPRLHQAIRSQTPAPYPSVWSVYREMVPALLRQQHDPSHFIRRENPPPAAVKSAI